MLWQILTDAIHSRHPEVDLKLNDGAPADAVAAAESKLDQTFPQLLRDLLLAHDGQTQDELGLPAGTEPIPPIPLGNHECTSGGFLPLARIVDATLANRDLTEFDVPSDGDEFDLVGPVRLHRNHIVISDPGSGDIIAVDLEPAGGGNPGQVVAINHDPSAICLIASDLTEFFDVLADGYRSGRFTFEEDDGFLCPIVIS